MSGRGVGELAAASVAELQRRWQQVLGPPSSPSRHQVSADAIAARAAECFPAHPVAWSAARQHSPDIMIAAASPGEVERGNFLLVLGELHLASNTLAGRLWVEQHPDPARLIAAEQADRGPQRIVAIPAKDHPNVTSRTSPPSAILGPGQLYWSSAITDSLDPDESDTVMPGAAMTVVRRGEDLVVQVMPVRHRTGLLRGHRGRDDRSRRRRVPAGGSGGAPAADHDRPVRAEPGAVDLPGRGLGLGLRQGRAGTLLPGAALAADHQLPERVFYRVPVELKPTAADFRSIVLVNLLAKHIRQTHAAGHTQYTVTEMLPDLGQLWLTDREGRRYSSELRFVAYDSMR